MDETYIEPDPGQTATIEVDDPADFYWIAYQWKQPVFIGDVKVVILSYNKLESLGYINGHRASMEVQGLK